MVLGDSPLWEFSPYIGVLIPLALLQGVMFLSLIRTADWYEREPFFLLFMLGAWGATGAYILAVVGSPLLARVFISTSTSEWVSKATVEELSKGLALVAAFYGARFMNRRFESTEFQGVTDGIVYGAAVGIGFTFTEDISYLLENIMVCYVGALTSSCRPWKIYLDRVGFATVQSLSHAMYTGVFGAALGLASWQRRLALKLVYPVGGFGIAVAMHAIHNIRVRHSIGVDLVTNSIDIGFFLTILFLMTMWLRYQKRVIAQALKTEPDLVSAQELNLILGRYIDRSLSYWDLLRKRGIFQLRLLKLRHNELVDLALLKHLAMAKIVDPKLVDEKRSRILRHFT